MSTVREEWQLACPACGRDTDLQVEFKCWARLTLDGTDAVDDHHDWDDTSLMRCSACRHAATVAHFKIETDDDATGEVQS